MSQGMTALLARNDTMAVRVGRLTKKGLNPAARRGMEMPGRSSFLRQLILHRSEKAAEGPAACLQEVRESPDAMFWLHSRGEAGTGAREELMRGGRPSSRLDRPRAIAGAYRPAARRSEFATSVKVVRTEGRVA